MLAAETLTRFKPFRGPSYRFPGQASDLPGLNGLFLNGTRTIADNQNIFKTHVEAGYIDTYVDYEKRYQPPEIQALLDDVQSIPDPAERTEALFHLLQEVSAAYAYPTPQWVKTAKPMCQIMVDRYYNPDLDSPDPAIQQTARSRWNELQSRQDRDFYDNVHFAGGTFAGIMAKMEYLKEMAGGLYLNPIFESDTIHGYNTADYFSVNHRFAGFSDDEFAHATDEEREILKCIGLQQFDRLTDEIPIVMDIAVNHTGRAHHAFQDIEQHGAESSYKSWYQDTQFDDRGKLVGWKGWWGHDTLPVLDHYSPAVQQHFLGESYTVGQPAETQSEEWKSCVASIQDADSRSQLLSDPKLLKEAQRKLGVIGFWSAMMSGNKSDGTKKRGGWRLDVPNDINRPAFWNEFRQLVKTIDPELWTVGEIWDNENEAYWLNGDKFDGVMNYRFWQWTLDYLIGATPTRSSHLSGDRASSANSWQFADRVNWFVARHPKQVVQTMMNNAGTHDVIRIGDLLGNNDPEQDKTSLGLTILMTLPGSPCIWAGDEMGMRNEGCPIVTDPMNRKPLTWGKEDTALTKQVQQLASLRETHTAMHTSNIQFVDTGHPDILTYVRTSDPDDQDKNSVLVMVNRSNTSVEVPLDTLSYLDMNVQEYLTTNQEVDYTDSSIVLPPNCSVVYTSTP